MSELTKSERERLIRALALDDDEIEGHAIFDVVAEMIGRDEKHDAINRLAHATAPLQWTSTAIVTDVEALYGLLKKAYGAGFVKGNGMDGGCRPDDHGDFQEFWDGLGGGDLTSALAAMLDRAAEHEPLPDLQPGVQIPFRQGDYMVRQVHYDNQVTTVEMQDAKSYTREHTIAKASEGCTECGYPAGLHNLACSQDRRV